MRRQMQETKRQSFPAGLWVVSTPIGNLGDVTERLRGALEEADWILCEDTRRVAQLCEALRIPVGGRLKRLDAHTEADRSQYWVRILQEPGVKVALLSDAGTPGVSDPGARLVRAVRDAQIRVTPIVGPSAVTALLAASGLEAPFFGFYGFFPRRAQEQAETLERVAQAQAQLGAPGVWVWFESPQRLLSTLSIFAERWGDQQMVVGKELTKVFERFFYGTAQSVLQQVEQELDEQGKRGEWCLAIALQAEPFSRSLESDLSAGGTPSWELTVQCLIQAGITASEIAKLVSQHFGVPRNQVYQKVILHK
jgi:16S rRNA (cytidine1402-2'-O)-methyltransferase